MSIVPFAGFDRNVQIDSGGVSIIATLEVGPRILFLGPTGGTNELKVYEKDKGAHDDGAYHSYGGHRLWVAPEDLVKTYAPDSVPPSYSDEGGRHTFETAVDPYGITKRVEIQAGENGSFRIRHTVTNRGTEPKVAAAWGITVMETGGEALIPQSPVIPHTDRLLPVRPIALWGYVRMSDSRYTWGDEVVRLRHDAAKGPTKIGSFVSQGIAAYANHGNTFVKRFAAVEGASYPDFGCNFETFAREDMLEVESLGPLMSLAPGGSTTLDETWYLLLNETPPTGDAECGEWFRGLELRCPFRPL